MSRQELLHEIDEIFYLSRGTLSGKEKLKEIEGWDSMAVLNFISLLDSRCAIIVAPDAIAACVTVDDLVRLAELPGA